MSTRKKRLIPLFLLPSYWFLNKKEKKIKYIEYYYSGKEKDLMLCDLLYNDNELIKKLKILEIQKKYSEISDYDFEIKKLNILLEHNMIESEKYDKYINDVNLKFNKISNKEYKKINHNLKKLPWFDISSELIIAENGDINISLEFDWNEYFIEYLKDIGYKGSNEREIIDKWFYDLISSSVEEENEEIDENFFNKNRIFSEKNILRKINRKDFQSRENGITDISEYF